MEAQRSFADRAFEAWFYSRETVWLGALATLLFQVAVTGLSGDLGGFPNLWVWLLFTATQFVLLLGRRRYPLATFTGHACVVALSALLFHAGSYCWLPFLVALGSHIVRSSLRSSLFAGGCAILLSVLIATSFEPNESFRIESLIPVLATVAIAIAASSFFRWRQESLLSRDRALVAEQETRAAIERQQRAEEMSRIASELHDSVGHNLTGIITLTEGIMDTPAHHGLNEEIKVVNELAREALEETRFVVQSIGSPGQQAEIEPQQAGKPRTWDDITDLVAKVRTAGLAVVLTEHGKRVDQPHLTELGFLVFREALTNVMRHAVSATRAVVSLTFEAECLKITVHDNGKQVTSPCKAGTGLTAMSKRIRDAGGDVTTTSTSNGWKLTARIPYQS